MRTHLFATVAAGAATALTVGLGTSPAVAVAATWTVNPGGAFSTPGPAHFSFLTDITTGASFQCQRLAVVGTFKSGSGLTNPIGQITGASTVGQLGILCGSTIQFVLTFSHFPMDIRAMTFDATTGVTAGMITGIHITLSAPGGGAPCTGTIDGTGPAANNGQVHFDYLNAGELHLTVAGDLHAYNVTGCGGLIHSGDAISYRAKTFPLNVRSGLPNTITSP